MEVMDFEGFSNEEQKVSSVKYETYISMTFGFERPQECPVVSYITTPKKTSSRQKTAGGKASLRLFTSKAPSPGSTKCIVNKSNMLKFWQVRENYALDTPHTVFDHAQWFEELLKNTSADTSLTKCPSSYCQYIKLVKLESSVNVIMFLNKWNKISTDCLRDNLARRIVGRAAKGQKFMLAQSPLFSFNDTQCVWERVGTSHQRGETSTMNHPFIHWLGILDQRKIWAGLGPVNKNTELREESIKAILLKYGPLTVEDISKVIASSCLIPHCMQLIDLVCRTLLSCKKFHKSQDQDEDVTSPKLQQHNSPRQKKDKVSEPVKHWTRALTAATHCSGSVSDNERQTLSPATRTLNVSTPPVVGAVKRNRCVPKEPEQFGNVLVHDQPVHCADQKQSTVLPSLHKAEATSLSTTKQKKVKEIGEGGTTISYPSKTVLTGGDDQIVHQTNESPTVSTLQAEQYNNTMSHGSSISNCEFLKRSSDEMKSSVCTPVKLFEAEEDCQFSDSDISEDLYCDDDAETSNICESGKIGCATSCDPELHKRLKNPLIAFTSPIMTSSKHQNDIEEYLCPLFASTSYHISNFCQTFSHKLPNKIRICTNPPTLTVLNQGGLLNNLKLLSEVNMKRDGCSSVPTNISETSILEKSTRTVEESSENYLSPRDENNKKPNTVYTNSSTNLFNASIHFPVAQCQDNKANSCSGTNSSLDVISGTPKEISSYNAAAPKGGWTSSEALESTEMSCIAEADTISNQPVHISFSGIPLVTNNLASDKSFDNEFPSLHFHDIFYKKSKPLPPKTKNGKPQKIHEKLRLQKGSSYKAQSSHKRCNKLKFADDLLREATHPSGKRGRRRKRIGTNKRDHISPQFGVMEESIKLTALDQNVTGLVSMQEDSNNIFSPKDEAFKAGKKNHTCSEKQFSTQLGNQQVDEESLEEKQDGTGNLNCKAEGGPTNARYSDSEPLPKRIRKKKKRWSTCTTPVLSESEEVVEKNMNTILTESQNSVDADSKCNPSENHLCSQKASFRNGLTSATYESCSSSPLEASLNEGQWSQSSKGKMRLSKRQRLKSYKVRDEEETSGIGKLTRRIAPVFDVDNIDKYMVPLQKGWVRELVTRVSSVIHSKDVYYHTPKGKKLRSSIETKKYLLAMKEEDLTVENFTFFRKELGFGEPYEVVRLATVRGHNSAINQNPPLHKNARRHILPRWRSSRRGGMTCYTSTPISSNLEESLELCSKLPSDGFWVTGFDDIHNSMETDAVTIENESGELTGFEEWIKDSTTKKSPVDTNISVDDTPEEVDNTHKEDSNIDESIETNFSNQLTSDRNSDSQIHSLKSSSNLTASETSSNSQLAPEKSPNSVAALKMCNNEQMPINSSSVTAPHDNVSSRQVPSLSSITAVQETNRQLASKNTLNCQTVTVKTLLPSVMNSSTSSPPAFSIVKSTEPLPPTSSLPGGLTAVGTQHSTSISSVSTVVPPVIAKNGNDRPVPILGGPQTPVSESNEHRGVAWYRGSHSKSLREINYKSTEDMVKSTKLLLITPQSLSHIASDRDVENLASTPVGHPAWSFKQGDRQTAGEPTKPPAKVVKNSTDVETQGNKRMKLFVDDGLLGLEPERTSAKTENEAREVAKRINHVSYFLPRSGVTVKKSHMAQTESHRVPKYVVLYPAKSRQEEKAPSSTTGVYEPKYKDASTSTHDPITSNSPLMKHNPTQSNSIRHPARVKQVGSSNPNNKDINTYPRLTPINQLTPKTSPNMHLTVCPPLTPINQLVPSIIRNMSMNKTKYPTYTSINQSTPSISSNLNVTRTLLPPRTLVSSNPPQSLDQPVQSISFQSRNVTISRLPSTHSQKATNVPRNFNAAIYRLSPTQTNMKPSVSRSMNVTRCPAPASQVHLPLNHQPKVSMIISNIMSNASQVPSFTPQSEPEHQTNVQELSSVVPSNTTKSINVKSLVL